MLKSLRLHNFKTFLNAEFHFAQRHLLIGKNNSGKTNLCAALRFLSMTRHVELAQACGMIPGGIAEVRNWHVKSNQIELSIECRLELDGRPIDFKYELVLAHEWNSRLVTVPEEPLKVVRERLAAIVDGQLETMLLENDGRGSKLTHERQVFEERREDAHSAVTLSPRNATMLSKLYELGDANRRAILFRNYLGSWRYFNLNPSEMRLARAPTAPAWPFSPDGSELANALFQLKNSDEPRYRRIIDRTRCIEPSLESVGFMIAPDQPPLPFVSLQGQPRAGWPGLSDGTLRILALSCIIEVASMFKSDSIPVPFLAIIEEPENGIYPGILRQVHGFFEEWAPTAQFLFTSHSPYFIDMFDADRKSVTVLRKAQDRTQVFVPPEPATATVDDSFTLSEEYASELF